MDRDFLIDLYHFGGELHLDKAGKLQGNLGGAASLGQNHPSISFSMDVDQANTDHLFKYHIKGPLNSFLSRLPLKYHHLLENDFADAYAELDGRCTRILKGVEFHSSMEVKSKDNPLLENITIYCKVDPTTPSFIDQGNFVIPRMNLAELFSPFLFIDKQFVIYGDAYFEGSWNPSHMHVKYTPYEATMEGDDFVFGLKPEGQQRGQVALRSFPGEHFFDFERNQQYGRLYVEDGYYLDKITGLMFASIDTQLILKEKVSMPRNFKLYHKGCV